MQALNNWGLVLQELSTMRTPSERVLLVHQSVAKFRRAIRLRPEFDRACYNLGTVYYAHACSLQNEVQNPQANQVRLAVCDYDAVVQQAVMLPGPFTTASFCTVKPSLLQVLCIEVSGRDDM